MDGNLQICFGNVRSMQCFSTMIKRDRVCERGILKERLRSKKERKGGICSFRLYFLPWRRRTDRNDTERTRARTGKCERKIYMRVRGNFGVLKFERKKGGGIAY